MSTQDDANQQRWTLLKTEKQIGPYMPGQAIPDYFAAHPEIGSPIGPEVDWDAVPGGKLRAFSGGNVGWDATGGARLVTG